MSVLVLPGVGGRAQLPYSSWLLAQLDATVDRVSHVGENPAGERARRAGVAHHQALLPEGRHRGLDVGRLEAPVRELAGRRLVGGLLQLEEGVAAHLDVRGPPVRVADHFVEAKLLAVEL